MTTIVAQQDQINANTAPQPAAAPAPQPAIIASRRSCDADGVGLSHYILMDRKPTQ
ncbi:MAG: modified peptide precursor CbpA [Candidatus Nitricoxidivorans perseverans]|uniref:Modified peptide CbpA n=1 Tax=Candidatus Nitricoxidivorans perseverans TaxID=2975601 RepID=A0AA49IXU4_9PROT|nr:MAG: modified peptide precursor CbpA [Candidatus Nitricoxidivorans perseverans]